MTLEEANNRGRELYAQTFKDPDACRKRWDEGRVSDERRSYYIAKAEAGEKPKKAGPGSRWITPSPELKKPANDGYRW